MKYSTAHISDTMLIAFQCVITDDSWPMYDHVRDTPVYTISYRAFNKSVIPNIVNLQVR